ncbi:MAG: hypothetical protein IPM80_08360 [Proteobacteria bacterium]|nr:hypothetical protein [Pseudomonadota bacterium]
MSRLSTRAPLRGMGVALTLLLSLGALTVYAEESPDGPPKYLGVVTCAGSTCHGAGRPVGDARISQTEFLSWHRDDAHSKAYRVLIEDKGQRIARNLGIDNAANAPECLTCHATFVPAEVRGKRFQLSDGVGCESCHGPASKWLGQHVTGEASREDNIRAGMVRTEEPVTRANLCLACHLGTQDKFANHRLMGAGHPRLSFELDTYTLLQPAHYRVDADYRERKHLAPHVQVWAIGQTAAAARTFELFTSDKWAGKGPLPEFAFFDCHACHHAMNEPRWAPRETTGLPPGVPRINDAHVLMLLYLTRAIEPALAEDLHKSLLALHKASTDTREATMSAANALKELVKKVDGAVRAHNFSKDETLAILDSLVKGGVAGDYRDFAAAEQAVMGVHALADSLTDAKQWSESQAGAIAAQIKVLYTVLADQNAYQPARFSGEMQNLAAALK